MAKENIYLASKPRYEILDGLRGVAAMMVVIFHLFESYSKGPATQIVNHGYLAVDFFFVLSGFVIGYAYDDRWDKMTVMGFFKRRLVRLHPLVVIGTLAGACLMFFQIGPVFPRMAGSQLGQFLLCIVLGCLMIPITPALDVRGWGETFPLNGPQWSLFLEYLANILYVVLFRRLPKAALAVLCACSAFLTLDLTLGWDVFDILRRPHYNVIGGWSLTGEQLYIGFTRLLYPFLAGLLISRILSSRRERTGSDGALFRLRGGFWWCSLLLVAIMATPCIGGRQGVPDGLFQALAILVCFPLIILAGAGSTAPGAFTSRLSRFLGEISYPLYLTHFPFALMQYNWAAVHADAPLWQHIALGIGVFLFSIGLAYAVLKVYDQPVRDWLREHWLKRNDRKRTV